MSNLSNSISKLIDDKKTERIANILSGSNGCEIDKIANILSGSNGCEIGGPSEIFGMIYHKAKSCDGVNFSNDTIWTGKLSEDYEFHGNKLGKQLIMDATDLGDIDNETYDFVMSSNNLEHIANPMKAVSEWLRILKHGGFLLIVVPNKEYTFDHNREITTFEHICSDYDNDITEHDLTHLDEILCKHDLSLDPQAGTFEEFKKRSLDNYNNRCLHQHVFDMDLLEKIMNYFDCKIVLESTIGDNYLIFIIKSSPYSDIEIINELSILIEGYETYNQELMRKNKELESKYYLLFEKNNGLENSVVKAIKNVFGTVIKKIKE